MDKEDKSKLGKKSRASGARFELKVRKDLESKEWVVDKWSNNVELNFEWQYNGALATEPKEGYNGKLIPAKHKFRGPGIPMAMGTGFPDFICYRQNYLTIQDKGGIREIIRYEVIGVESKSNGYLTEEEKEKCIWMLDNNVFSKILIA